jgi:hypothetical protein
MNSLAVRVTLRVSSIQEVAMIQAFPRRALLKFASIAIPLQALLAKGDGMGSQPESMPVNDTFPAHQPELVREMVIVSHFNLQRVRELVEARPALARAAMDWGFGDWEDALGAASHTGNRAIAEYLIERGARPSIFSAAMLGQLEVVRSFIVAQPGVQKIRGPHSIPLLAHARQGGPKARPVLEYLQSLGDAGSEPEPPLEPQQRANLLGTYIFGIAAGQRVDVTVENGGGMQNQLTWTRRGTTGRALYHLGNSIFYPAGAPAVKIAFKSDDQGMLMTVSDPDVVLTARQRKS